jgi:FKBP-type peptidyl-prolyl cis-trans isomerase
LIWGCHRHDTTINGYTKKDGLYFKLLSIGDGKLQTDTGDVLWVDMAVRNLKDSVFWDTRHNSAQAFFVRDTSFTFCKHLYTLSEGDSVQYLLPAKAFFKEFFKTEVPFFSKNDSAVKLSVKIRDIISEGQYEDVLDSLEAASEEKREEEYGHIDNYITLNFDHSIEFSKDAYLMLTTACPAGDSIKWGRRVTILYKGYFLDGRLADQTPGHRPFDFKMGQEGQVIEGLRLALLHLKKGEKAKIILPSRLAFGSTGSTNGSIAPYTPLLYEVEVLDVKKQK